VRHEGLGQPARTKRLPHSAKAIDPGPEARQPLTITGCALLTTRQDIALERLGPPRRVAEEFGKLESAGPLRWIAAWLVFGVYACTGIGLIVMAVPVLRRGGALEALLSFHVLTVSMGYFAVLAIGALAIWSFGLRLVRGWDEQAISRLQWRGQRFSWAGLLLTAIGVVTGAFWAKASWGSFWHWDARELGGAAVIGWHTKRRKPCRDGKGFLGRSPAKGYLFRPGGST
jgi:hypothetical protein